MSSSRVLVVSFAFPPIHVQMTSVAARAVAELSLSGFEVDVLAADHNVWPALPTDNGLVGYVDQHARSVVRLGATVPPGRLRAVRNRLGVPDGMIAIVPKAVEDVLARGAGTYAAAVTISPFNSVNKVMTLVKARNPGLPWIAYLGDPMDGNPLVQRPLVRNWHAMWEGKVAAQADRIVHSSEVALLEMMVRHPDLDRHRTHVSPHTFDSRHYPARPKKTEDRIVLRFVGTLIRERSPEPLFQALCLLLERKPELAATIRVELVGARIPAMLETPSARQLGGIVSTVAPVDFMVSLELMYDADILLLIESGVANPPFVPSKLTDYMGANTPILGIVPEGPCRRILQRLGATIAAPADIPAIAAGLERLIAERKANSRAPWCDDDYRQSFDLRSGGGGLASVVRDEIDSNGRRSTRL